MKRNLACLTFLLFSLIWLLSACAQGAPSPSNVNCSAGGEICISVISANSSAIGQAFPIKISVTSNKDNYDLFISLDTLSEVVVDGPETWENNLTFTSNQSGLAEWGFSIKGGQTVTFTRVLHFPNREGIFNAIATVFNKGRFISAADSFYFAQNKNVGQVIRSGTAFPPITPNVTSAVYGPGTPVPFNPSDSTATPKSSPLQTLNTPNPLVSTGYPPPATATTTPTNHPYP